MRREMKRGQWLLVATLIACSAWACGDDDDGAPAGTAGAGGEAGEGNRAGESGSGGDNGAAGSGGAADGGRPSCEEIEPCSPSTCPSLESLRDDCTEANTVSYRSSCGGTFVEVSGVADSFSWAFDEDGNVIGGSSEGEGSCQFWGTQCSAVGPAEPLCADASGCIKHASCDTWGANFGCPESPEEAASYCAFTANQVQRYASACGGSVITANNGVQGVAYTFDERGRLVGVSALGDVGDCDQWGEQCEATGEGEPLCDGAGGQGGAAGQGGSAP